MRVVTPVITLRWSAERGRLGYCLDAGASPRDNENTRIAGNSPAAAAAEPIIIVIVVLSLAHFRHPCVPESCIDIY